MLHKTVQINEENVQMSFDTHKREIHQTWQVALVVKNLYKNEKVLMHNRPYFTFTQ